MFRTRKALLASLLIAVTVALGYALAGIPNVELMTVTVFCAGYLLGPRFGAIVGGASITLHSVFNPLGIALPPLLIAQIIGFVLIGVCGGLVGPLIVRVRRRWLAMAIAGLCGLALTFVYDVLTNVGAFLVITGEHAPDNLFKFVAAGIVFMGMHMVWNTAIFIVAVKSVLNVLNQFRMEAVQ